MSHAQKVKFCWIPSQKGIQGNHKTDSVAESALVIGTQQKLKNAIR